MSAVRQRHTPLSQQLVEKKHQLCMFSTQQPGTKDKVNTQNVWHCCLLFLQELNPSSNITMKRLMLPLLCWFLSAQLAASTHETKVSNRFLLATTVTPLATPVTLSRQQFVQATWALQNVTCAGVAVKDRRFNNTLATAVIQNSQNALTAAGIICCGCAPALHGHHCKSGTRSLQCQLQHSFKK
jgi:hypothetical protein